MNDNKKRILITGVTGFIGNALMKTLLEQHYSIRVLVRDRGKFSGFPVDVFQGDLLMPHTLTGIEKDIDIVIHCAGFLGKWGVAETLIHQTNVQGSLNLLERFKNTSLHRFIYLSAGGVTGPVAGGIADEHCACQPATAYEKSKYAAEQQLLRFAQTHALPVLIVRPTFTYGPGDRHKLPLFKAVNKRRFAFIGDGKSLISPVYIDDLINGIILALHKGRIGETYIISGDKAVSKEELIYAIADALKAPRPGIRIPYRSAWIIAVIIEKFAGLFDIQPFITRSKVMMMGDNFGYSCEKAKTELFYQPQVSLKQGITKTVSAYRQQGLL